MKYENLKGCEIEVEFCRFPYYPKTLKVSRVTKGKDYLGVFYSLRFENQTVCINLREPQMRPLLFSGVTELRDARLRNLNHSL